MFTGSTLRKFIEIGVHLTEKNGKCRGFGPLSVYGIFNDREFTGGVCRSKPVENLSTALLKPWGMFTGITVLHYAF